MDQSTTKLPQSMGQRFVHYARKVYHPLGFRKGHNFPLFIITCGALIGFALARFQFMNFDGIFWRATAPGEQYWYFTSNVRKVGIKMHVVTVLWAIFLVVFQFVPVIRHKAILFHRINGYVCIILLTLGNVGALMIARHTMGGAPITQMWIGSLAVMVTVALILSYINIKALQIDQHRAWMLRAWSWATSIISLRLIMLAAQRVIMNWYTFYSVISCREIWFLYQFYANAPDASNPARLRYPQCSSATSPGLAVVPTRYDGPGPAGPENVAALFANTFGLSGTLALLIHAILVELYLALTPAESARLRMVSYERQLKAGRKHPEKGGLTSTRLGDAPPWWNSPMAQEKALAGKNSSSSDSSLDRGLDEPKNDLPPPATSNNV